MKKILIAIAAAGFMAFLFVNYSYRSSLESQEETRGIILNNLLVFSSSLDSLTQKAIKFKKNEIDVDQMKTEISHVRLLYKKIEMVTEYYFPEHMKFYINGAPLDHLDPYPIDKNYINNAYHILDPVQYSKSMPLDRLEVHYQGVPQVISPEGLQRLDEILFGEESEIDRGEVLELTIKLTERFRSVREVLTERSYYYDFELLEMARLELVRIFSLGVTGFDTPGSLNGITESATALSALQQLMQPTLNQTNSVLKNEINQDFDRAVSFIEKNKNFYQFDRLKFLKDYINPLYKKLYELKQNEGISTSAEKYWETPSWNPNSTDIFSDEFLNPYYYSMLKQKNDSPELRDLGKKLFYETKLSKDGKMSCVSCHQPERAFSDGLPKSQSNILGKTVLRNSPTLINSIYSDRFFYDLRAYDIEDQTAHVIGDHLEFNTNFDVILQKLNADGEYKNLIRSAFKKEKINRYEFSSALASYVISLRSFNSEFDKYVRGEIKNISPKVKRGFNLFMGKASCGTCHFAPTFSGLVPPLFKENESEVLGILENPKSDKVDSDLGRFANGVFAEDKEIYRRSFKTTTVRNAELTAPYFHNGAYQTLEEVLDFYNEGGAAGKEFSYEVPNQTLSSDSLKLTKKEIKDLIAFIQSLTDNPSAN